MKTMTRTLDANVDATLASRDAARHEYDARVANDGARASRVMARYEALVGAGRNDEADALFDAWAPCA